MAGVVTQEYLMRVIEYDRTTGDFRWKGPTSRNVKAGGLAGYVRPPDNYLQIGVMGRQYRAHRLAWLYCYGSFPDGFLDHKNGNRLDNRIDNLRIVTNAENMQNMRSHRADSTTKVLGVERKGRKFSACIAANGKRFYLGTFPTVEEASAAYLAKKRDIHSTCTI